MEVRESLYAIHKYNCDVAKFTHKYPRTRIFDLHLIKYVELEFDALYDNNTCPSEEHEILCELRVFRLLQGMFRQAILDPDSNNENAEVIVNSAILRLLGEVNAIYLVAQNKIIYNLINKLLKSLQGTSSEFSHVNLRNSFIWEIHGNLATSDYGTDDSDSDLGNDFGHVVEHDRVSCERSQDCVEVNGITPVPVIEFIDDDDSYVGYVQKKVLAKRKVLKAKETSIPPKISTKQSHEIVAHDQVSTIIVCSDSEDENCNVPFSEKATRNKKTVKTPEKNIRQRSGIATFEIMDDDDSNGPDYILSLQEEVPTNKRKKYNAGKVYPKEVIVCSDSESDDGPDDRHQVAPSVGEIKNSPPKNEKMESVSETFQLDTVKDFIKEEASADVQNDDLALAPIMFQEHINLIMSKNELDSMVDPSVKFEQLLFTQLSEGINLPKFGDIQDIQGVNEDATHCKKVGFDGPSSPGGPVLSSRLESFEDFDNFQECRLNDSLLEEILQDDSYLLEGRKEFEDLEYFLFNDNADNQIADCNETVFQSEIFVKNEKGVASRLKTEEVTYDFANLFKCSENIEGNSYEEQSISKKVKTLSPRTGRKFRTPCKRQLHNVDSR